jgi:hypothetical protein
MGLKARVTNKRELKKQCYKILSKYHDLEKKRARELTLASKNNGKYCLLLLTDELEKFLTSSMGTLNNTTYPKVQKFFGRYLYYKNLIKINSNSKKPIRKSYLPRLLRSYTNALNEIINMNPTIFIDRETWGNVYLLAVMIWDHRF